VLYGRKKDYNLGGLSPGGGIWPPTTMTNRSTRGLYGWAKSRLWVVLPVRLANTVPHTAALTGIATLLLSSEHVRDRRTDGQTECNAFLGWSPENIADIIANNDSNSWQYDWSRIRFTHQQLMTTGTKIFYKNSSHWWRNEMADKTYLQ